MPVGCVMRIVFHSGTGTQLVRSVQMALAGARADVLAQGVLYPDGLGALGQSDLFTAALSPAEGHPLLALRGLTDPVDAQDFALRARAGLAGAGVMRAQEIEVILPLGPQS